MKSFSKSEKTMEFSFEKHEQFYVVMKNIFSEIIQDCVKAVILLEVIQIMFVVT